MQLTEHPSSQWVVPPEHENKMAPPCVTDGICQIVFVSVCYPEKTLNITSLLNRYGTPIAEPDAVNQT
jgi:hypothetical protein